MDEWYRSVILLAPCDAAFMASQWVIHCFLYFFLYFFVILFGDWDKSCIFAMSSNEDRDRTQVVYRLGVAFLATYLFICIPLFSFLL